MDYTVLPFKALVLVVLLVCAGCGAVYWRNNGKWIGALMGVAAGCVLMTLVAFIMPVKLTTNTATYNASQTQQAAERHKKIPPKVVVEVKTFEQMQADEEARSIKANQKLKDDLR
jgi:hypothetical protein